MAKRINFISAVINVDTHNVEKRSDENFTFPSGITKILGFYLHSDYPERMRFGGRIGLNIDSKQIFDNGTFAKQFAKRDDIFYSFVDEKNNPNGIESVGSRKMIFQYKDELNANYSGAVFSSYKVFIEFMIEQES